jgi:hypothetical protein
MGAEKSIPSVAEQAFAASSDGRVRVEVVPRRALDASYYGNVVLPSFGAENVEKMPVASVKADVTRSAFEKLLADPAIEQLNVASSGSGQSDSGAEQGEASGFTNFVQGNWAWLVGLAGAGIALQLAARAGRRKMAGGDPVSAGAARTNPNGPSATAPITDDTQNGPAQDGTAHDGQVVVRSGSVGEQQVGPESGPSAPNPDIEHISETRQREIAQALSLVPGDEVTVYVLPASAHGATGAYEWTADGFRAT